MGVRLSIAVLLALVALPLAHALAAPQDDFNAVYRDWKGDKRITPCRFSEGQLRNAYDVATGSPDFQYSTDFTDAVQREIARWRSRNGGCSGVAPLSVRRRSPLYGAHIVRVVAHGGPATEYVKVRNASRRTLSFAKATLRNRGRRRGAFPAGFRLGRGKVALVHAGCAPGQNRPSARGTTVWLCRHTELFRDNGDVARLVDAKGIAVSQRGFGSQALLVSY